MVAASVSHGLELAIAQFIPGATEVWLVAIEAIDPAVTLFLVLQWIRQAQGTAGACLVFEVLVRANLDNSSNSGIVINVKALDNLLDSSTTLLLGRRFVLPGRLGVSVVASRVRLLDCFWHGWLIDDALPTATTGSCEAVGHALSERLASFGKDPKLHRMQWPWVWRRRGWCERRVGLDQAEVTAVCHGGHMGAFQVIQARLGNRGGATAKMWC